MIVQVNSVLSFFYILINYKFKFLVFSIARGMILKMKNKIKTMYVVHHSHTDIGYTDLQERIITVQANYINTVLEIMKKTENQKFRWNCETYYCVEVFLKQATEQQKKEFFQLVKENKIGLSAIYLNFNDLVDYQIIDERLDEIVKNLNNRGIKPKTAMIADINGISMGQRDALINHGIEFLFTNIHCHHGMYPLYQNQTAYFWENEAGKKILVWNGEHYNLGNVLGIKPNQNNNYMTTMYQGKKDNYSNSIKTLKDNLDKYIKECEENGYNYDFIISSVSGAFTDNAPPNLDILETIEKYNKQYPDSVQLKMVSLQELYQLIKDKLTDIPVYRGDLTDWWANGIGAAPYLVKHYKDAVRKYHLCQRLDPAIKDKYPEQTKKAQDNILLYAEHTCGHSATVSNPYETMVSNLEIRKNSYASKAHEYSSFLLNRVTENMGDIMRYYNTEGQIKVINPTNLSEKMPVEFYIETQSLKNARVVNIETEENMKIQISDHPRGILISFIDEFKPHETKQYRYEQIPAISESINTRKAYIGSEKVRDIVNDYDSVNYKLPYEFENKWFKLTYSIENGMTSFINKNTGKDMLLKGTIPFFTPIYEYTSIRKSKDNPTASPFIERQILGRNIRGKHAECCAGKIKEINKNERGDIFTTIEFVYDLPGTINCSVIIKFFEDIPKIDFKLQLGKTINTDIESIYLPLSLDLEEKQLYIKKGTEEFKPGIDQIPGSCMEYYVSDVGLAYTSKDGSILISTPDTALMYMGEMKHHPIKLCDNAQENNQRPIYSWIMNNTWETNFSMDLSGFNEFRYSLTLSNHKNVKDSFEKLEELQYKPQILNI